MGDHHHGAGIVVQMALQPSDTLGVEVVGRFVEQQQVGLRQQQPAQRDAAPLTTGQGGDRAVAGRAAQRVHGDVHSPLEVPRIRGVDLLLQLRLFGQQRVEIGVGIGHHPAHLVEPVDGLLDRPQALHDILRHGQVRVQFRLLRQITDGGSVGRPSLTGELGVKAGHDPHQRRLTRTVRTEHADLGAGQERQADIVQHRLAAGVGFVQPIHYIDVLIRSHCLARVAFGNRGRRFRLPEAEAPSPHVALGGTTRSQTTMTI